MNWVDIVIILIVVLSALFGVWRGFVREVLSVVGWVAALLVAKIYSPHLSPLFTGLVSNDTARYVLAFALLLFLTLLLGALVTHFMSKLIHLVGLQVTDRLLGTLFGFARGVIIVAIIVFFARPFYEEALWWQASQLMPHVSDLIDWSRLFIDDYTSQADGPVI